MTAVQCQYCGKIFNVILSKWSRCAWCTDKNLRKLKNADATNVFGYPEEEENEKYELPDLFDGGGSD